MLTFSFSGSCFETQAPLDWSDVLAPKSGETGVKLSECVQLPAAQLPVQRNLITTSNVRVDAACVNSSMVSRAVLPSIPFAQNMQNQQQPQPTKALKNYSFNLDRFVVWIYKKVHKSDVACVRAWLLLSKIFRLANFFYAALSSATVSV